MKEKGKKMFGKGIIVLSNKGMCSLGLKQIVEEDLYALRRIKVSFLWISLQKEPPSNPSHKRIIRKV